MLDDTWACLLGCVEDTLLRVWRMEGDAHARLLAAGAREGLLFKKVAITQLVRKTRVSASRSKENPTICGRSNRDGSGAATWAGAARTCIPAGVNAVRAARHSSRPRGPCSAPPPRHAVPRPSGAPAAPHGRAWQVLARPSFHTLAQPPAPRSPAPRPPPLPPPPRARHRAGARRRCLTRRLRQRWWSCQSIVRTACRCGGLQFRLWGARGAATAKTGGCWWW
jgi:hypothetical protein